MATTVGNTLAAAWRKARDSASACSNACSSRSCAPASRALHANPKRIVAQRIWRVIRLAVLRCMCFSKVSSVN